MCHGVPCGLFVLFDFSKGCVLCDGEDFSDLCFVDVLIDEVEYFFVRHVPDFLHGAVTGCVFVCHVSEAVCIIEKVLCGHCAFSLDIFDKVCDHFVFWNNFE